MSVVIVSFLLSTATYADLIGPKKFWISDGFSTIVLAGVIVGVFAISSLLAILAIRRKADNDIK